MTPSASWERLRRVRRGAMIVGLAASAIAAWQALANPAIFYPAYLTAYLYFLALALGSLAIAMIHALSGGAWGAAIHRPLEAAIATLPLLAVLGVPLAASLSFVYPWTQATTFADSAELDFKRQYFQTDFFLGRGAGYWLLWLLLGAVINRCSRRAGHALEPGLPARRLLAAVSGPGLVLYGLAATFSAVDWGMSLEPRWASTMYGVIHVAGHAISALSLAIVASYFVSSRAATEPFPGPDSISDDRWHDLGNLLLAFLMFWAYVGYMQFLIIWSGNLPEEIAWYLRRSTGWWRAAVAALMGGGFALPFAALLSRDMKRHGGRLALVAGWILAIRALEDVWLIVPAFGESAGSVLGLTLLPMLAIGGLWLAMYAWQLEIRLRLGPFQWGEAEAATNSPQGAAHGA